jgi:hypothetical protein
VFVFDPKKPRGVFSSLQTFVVYTCICPIPYVRYRTYHTGQTGTRQTGTGHQPSHRTLCDDTSPEASRRVRPPVLADGLAGAGRGRLQVPSAIGAGSPASPVVASSSGPDAGRIRAGGRTPRPRPQVRRRGDVPKATGQNTRPDVATRLEASGDVGPGGNENTPEE